MQPVGIQFEWIPMDYLGFNQTKHMKCVGLFAFSAVTLDKLILQQGGEECSFSSIEQIFVLMWKFLEVEKQYWGRTTWDAVSLK